MRSLATDILIWIGLVTCLFVVLSLVAGVPQLIKLSAHSAVTTGTVIATKPKEHGSVTVAYPVNGKFSVQVFTPYSLHVGDEVKVYYLPSKVETAVLSEPKQMLREQIAPALAASVVFGSIAAVVVAILRRLRKT